MPKNMCSAENTLNLENSIYKQAGDEQFTPTEEK
jgi:hypothetical protein